MSPAETTPSGRGLSTAGLVQTLRLSWKIQLNKGRPLSPLLFFLTLWGESKSHGQADEVSPPFLSLLEKRSPPSLSQRHGLGPLHTPWFPAGRVRPRSITDCG